MTEQYLGCDYANPPSQDPGWFAQQGFSFACRYLATGTKNRADLTPGEVARLSQAGVGIVSIWETTGGDENYTPGGGAFFTAEHGAHEGGRAVAQAKALGQPTDAPIYATVDFNARTTADMAAIREYMQAFAAAIQPYPLGVYGSYAVMDAVQTLTPWLWQTYAWSSGRLHPAAKLYQFKNTRPFDYDRAFGNPGWWTAGSQPVQTIPAAEPLQEEVKTPVPLTRLGDHGLAVSIVQALLVAAGATLTADGGFGPATLQAVKDFQTRAGLQVDGIVGPQTWTALAAVRHGPDQTVALTNTINQLQARLAQIADLAKEGA